MIGIGVDIGGTFVKFFVLNEKREILRKDRIETDASKGVDGFIAQIGDYINARKQEYGSETVTVAVGAPGDVDPQKGILRYNPNLKFTDAADWPLAKQLYDYTGILPYVVNDATLAAWGVYETDLNRQGTNVLVVTMGTGIGGGMIINKELYQGSNGTAGEIGHLKIVDIATGPQCGCGARGCLEAFVGTIGIKRRVLEATTQNPNSELAKLVQAEKNFKIEIVSRAAEKGCPVALKIWEDTGHYLGIGIANAILLLDLDTVVLAGGVSAAAPYFMPALQHVLQHQQIKTPFQHVKLLTSKNPNVGGVGAALYAIYRAQQKASPCA